MVLFDQTIQIATTDDELVQVIADSIRANEQLVTLKPKLLLIALRADLGYIYLLRSSADGSVGLRLIVDTASNVRGAFRGKTAKEGLTGLLQGTSDMDRSVSEAARQHLATLKRVTEDTIQSSSPSESEDISYEDFAPNSGVLGNTKKPLPSTNSMSPNPWNPARLTSITFFLTTIGAGIAFGINWRRLGKPEWMWTTILMAILVPLFIIVAIVIALKFAVSSSLVLGLVLLLAGANWGFVYTLWFLQRGAYKKWEESGDVRTLEDYRYNFPAAIGVGALIAVGFVAIVGLYTYFNGRPNVMQADGITVTYPSSWAAQDKSQLPQCQVAAYDCLIVVADARFGSTVIIVGQFERPASMMTPSAIARFSRKNMLDQLDVNIGTNENVQIDNREAVRFFYSAPTPNKDVHYGMEIYVISEPYAYEITVESTNEGIFREQHSEIDAFINGIDLE